MTTLIDLLRRRPGAVAALALPLTPALAALALAGWAWHLTYGAAWRLPARRPRDGEGWGLLMDLLGVDVRPPALTPAFRAAAEIEAATVVTAGEAAARVAASPQGEPADPTPIPVPPPAATDDLADVMAGVPTTDDPAGLHTARARKGGRHAGRTDYRPARRPVAGRTYHRRSAGGWAAVVYLPAGTDATT